MSQPTADVTGTVEYSMDAWLMGKIPWALWVCLVGFVIVLHAENRGEIGAGVALVYLAALAVLLVGVMAIKKIESLDVNFLISLALALIGVMIVSVLVAVVVGSVGGKTGSGRLPWYSNLVNPPTHVVGWMMIYMGVIWIAFALYRHIRPARPILALSPAGVAYHRSWLKDLLIPWSEIREVGRIDVTNLLGKSHPYAVFVVISRDFFERQVAPKINLLAPPGAENIFAPKGEAIRMVLTTTELIVSIEDMRMSIEARWKAFRDKLTSVPQIGGPVGPSVVYGRWSLAGSWWPTVYLIAPLVGMAVALAHAKGFWPR